MPESIHLKSGIFSESDKYHFLSSDMFNYKWMNELNTDEQIVFLCEGTLMYYYESQIFELFKMLRTKFPSSIMIFEIMGNWGKNKIHPFVKRLNLNFPYLWGIKNLEWFKNNQLLIEKYESFFDRNKRKWGMISKIVNLSPSLKLKSASQIYKLKFQ